MLATLLFASSLAAQQDPITKAFDLERRGNYAAAADVYYGVLRTTPGDVQALLGLERALLPLNKTPDILPYVQAGLAGNPKSAALYGIGVRAWAAREQRDSIRAMAERWAAIAPGDESPYREWGAAALAMRDRAGAVAAYRLGRERLGRSDALAAELAQLAINDRDYATALREWVQALRRIPEYQSTAAAGLSQAPYPMRGELLKQLAADVTPAARSLEADLRARWGDPVGGFAVLQRSLPEDGTRSAAVLRAFLDQVRMFRGPDAKRAQGRALEALAARSSPSQAARLRLEAAEAYSDGGDRDAARRMLAGIADDRAAPGTIAADAGATLIGVLIDEGKFDDAARRLAELRPQLASDRHAQLRRELALGWARRGDVARAESVIAADSSIEGLAVSGWLHLYQGDVAGALKRFMAAGPFAGERVDATQRTALLALLQPIEADTLPELGRAFLTLAQGDTSEALDGFEKVASGLPPAAGGAELRLYAGQVAVAARKGKQAERLFRAAAAPEAPGTAPAAELALGELLLADGRHAEAIQMLEHLILTYPTSALVAQARRKLDEARGAVPET